MRNIWLAFLLLLLSTSSFGQFGGNSTYQFLNLTTSARVNALGGNQVSSTDSIELGMAYYNPSLLHSAMNSRLSINYVDYISDIRAGFALYAFDLPKIGTFAAGMHYLNYGKFIAADEMGTITGNFSAADYALNLMYSRAVSSKIRVGANLKPIYSKYESYNSLGIAVDLGVTYIDSAGLFSASLVARNMGAQLTTYVKGDLSERENLPFDLQLGFSQRLSHAPFRFSLTLQNLTDWELTDKSTWDYDNSDEDDYVAGKSDNALRQFFRHAVLGVEFLPSENVIVGVGYNYQRRRELSVSESAGAVGFSGGITIKVSKFRISYALAKYHLAGISNTFSVTTQLSDLF